MPYSSVMVKFPAIISGHLFFATTKNIYIYIRGKLLGCEYTDIHVHLNDNTFTHNPVSKLCSNPDTS